MAKSRTSRKTAKAPARKAGLNVDLATIREELLERINHNLFFADVDLGVLRADMLRKGSEQDPELSQYARDAKGAVAKAFKGSAKQARRLKRERRKAAK